jgi:hypothetical protein
MIPINRLERWPFPGNIPPDAVALRSAMMTDDDANVPSVYGALATAFGEVTGALVFELLRRLAAEAADKLGGGTPCISFHDEQGEFASMVEDDEITEEDEAEPGSDGEQEADEEDGTAD